MSHEEVDLSKISALYQCSFCNAYYVGTAETLITFVTDSIADPSQSWQCPACNRRCLKSETHFQLKLKEH